MRKWRLLAGGLAVLNLVSWSAAGALGICDLSLKALQEEAHEILIVHVEKVKAENPWMVAEVRCAHALKGDTRPGGRLVIRYPNAYPNEGNIIFGLQNGAEYLVLLGRPAPDGSRTPIGNVLSSWPVPAIGALPDKPLLRRLAEIAVVCVGKEEADFHRTALAVANLFEGSPNDLGQDGAELTLLVDSAIRARCRELVPPPLLSAYVIGTDLYKPSPEVLRKALFHVRRASWDQAYKAVDIRDKFRLVRDPALKDSMLCLMALGDAKVASFAAFSIRQWGDRDCVPLAIEVLRSAWDWSAADSCDRFLFAMAVKEPNVPEGARLAGDDRRKLQETVWTEEGLGSAEQRKARAEYWENWWKAVWVRNQPKAGPGAGEGTP